MNPVAALTNLLGHFGAATGLYQGGKDVYRGRRTKRAQGVDSHTSHGKLAHLKACCNVPLA